MFRLQFRWIFVSMFLIATCCRRIQSFWFFSCPHGNGQGQAGDVCSAFCRCHSLNTCEAGIQRCARPGVQGDRCHVTRPCAAGLSCHPGVQKCFHVPRRHGEPCVAGYECGSGLSCEPGVQVCFRHPRQYNEPCSAGFPCSPGLSCQPGSQRCLHHPRLENERCSAGYACADGLVCRLCDKPYGTCQLARVPALKDQDYDRPFNKLAFLVTHNSFSNSPKFAVWARNQRFSVSQQLQDGVRGLMLDIYPGWGKEDVRLCHASCFWMGSTNLLDTLVEIRKFLETNTREVITIFFEDYLKNPTILKHVFDQAGISPHVLLEEYWGDGINDWPTLTDMRRLGRLVVFNNNGLSGFPYTKYNMWRYVRENRYGNAGQNKKECVDRAESRWNKAWNDRWSLVLINWFSTAGNPLQPCLNSFTEIRDKLITCHDKFGFWANFVAVNYYTAGSGGGAFQVVKWLNNMLRRDSPVAKERKASFVPFPLIDTVNHSVSRANQKLQNEMEPIRNENTLPDEPGYGSGFHDLSDIIAHIMQQDAASSADVFNSNASMVFLRTVSSQAQNNKGSNIRKGHQINEPNRKFSENFEKNRGAPSVANNQFNHRNPRIMNHDLRSFHQKISQWDVSGPKLRDALEKRIENATNLRESSNSTNRQPSRYGGIVNALAKQENKNRKSKLHSYHHIAEAVLTNATRKVNHREKSQHQLLSIPSLRDKRRKIPNIRLRTESQGDGLQRGPHGKSPLAFSKTTPQRSLSAVRFQLPSAVRHDKKAARVNPSTKLRNLRRQLARLKAKLHRYLHLAPRRGRKNAKLHHRPS